jgi:EAL domain-containing protein (putative c-di-GMP-specific phosphodiesterase class I)
MIEIFDEPFTVAGLELKVNVSIGVAAIRPGSNPDDVLRAADEAMYVAKGAGKGQYKVHTPGLQSVHGRELGALAELRAAIRDQHLVLHYQPIFDLNTGAIDGVEALVRWDHPEKGLITPDEFVPLAERRGMVEEVGAYVLRRAADSARRWQAMLGPSTPFISVNLAASEIAEPALVRDVLDVLAVRDLNPHLLQIEITERSVVDAGISVLDSLKRAGVRIALDDFGTGYSSLAYLDQLPVDTIKLARGFIDRIGDPRVQTVTETMIAMAKALDLGTIAEGVERLEQVGILRRLGCDRAQGYHLARPMPERDLLELLRAAHGPDVTPARWIA